MRGIEAVKQLIKKAENADLVRVVCDVRQGSLISQDTPLIEGVDPVSGWVYVEGTEQRAGSYYQADYSAVVPRVKAQDLPDHCWVEEINE